MGITFKFLKAANGDSILISFLDNDDEPRNILIDGGTSATYHYKNKKGKAELGALGIEIEKFNQLHQVDSRYKIDLLILTHIDDDHIGGLLKWFEQDPNFFKLVGKIWFNSGRLISEHFKQKLSEEHDLTLNILNGSNTSIEQGMTFETYAATSALWDRYLILQGQVHDVFGLKVSILSPSENELRLLLNKWKDKDRSLNTSARNDYSKSIAKHIEDDEFNEDDAVYNGSSIAFILTCGSKNFLFLADSHPSVAIKGLSCFNFDSNAKLKAEFVKVSHHGSKFNTSKPLLETIDCDVFIISSSGQIHGLPDKQCLARIIESNDNPKILFNYPELVAKIFNKDDFSTNTFAVDEVTELNVACDEK